MFKKLNWTILVIVSGLIFIIDYFGGFNWLKSPIIQSIQKQQIRRYQQELVTKNVDGDTSKQVDLLNTQIDQLKEENQKLRRLLGANLPASWQFQPANIFRWQEDMIVIDVGEKEGVKTDMLAMAVLDQESKTGIVLGKVIKTNQYKAEIGLIGTKGLEAKAITESGIKGALKMSQGELKLTQVMQKETLNQGEKVMLSGGDGWLPGLLVGFVDRIDKVDTKVFQEALVTPAHKKNKLDKVFIVLSF